MSIKLSSEQQQFRDSVRRFLTDRITSTYLRNPIERSKQDDAVLWNDLMELGLSVGFAHEACEGLGLGMHELGLLAFEAGRVLLPQNVLEQAFWGSYCLTQCASADQVSDLDRDVLSEIVSGALQICFAYQNLPSDIVRVSETGTISGQVHMVARAQSADLLALFNYAEKSLYLVDLTQKCFASAVEESGVEYQVSESLDLTRVYEKLTLDTLSMRSVSNLDSEFLLGAWRVLVASEIAGACSSVVEMTTEYVKTRKQFGVPVGAFQAVKHRVADMHTYTEALRALCNFAGWSADHSRSQFSLAANSAIAYAVRRGPEVIESAIQAHGGIGFTWEHDLHLYLRRVRSLVALIDLGQADAQRLVAAAVGS